MVGLLGHRQTKGAATDRPRLNHRAITLGQRLKHLAPGLTTRSVLEKFAAVQMIDVQIPTTDGRELTLTRYTQPEPDLKLLLERLKFTLPPQPPPKITAAQAASVTAV